MELVGVALDFQVACNCRLDELTMVPVDDLHAIYTPGCKDRSVKPSADKGTTLGRKIE